MKRYLSASCASASKRDPRCTIAYRVDFTEKFGAPPGSRSAPIGTPAIR